MNTIRWITTSIVCITLLFPATVFSGAPERSARSGAVGPEFVHDVALSREGELHGQLVNRSGTGLADVVLYFYHTASGGELQATTDAEGRFRFRMEAGGVCEIDSGTFQQTCRVWMAAAAPPSASQGLLLVADDDQIQRGQSSCPHSQNHGRRRVVQRNPRRRKLLVAGGRVGMRAAMIPFMAAGALSAADKDDEDEEEVEISTQSVGNGDSQSAS